MSAYRFVSGDLHLAAHLAAPTGANAGIGRPAVVIAHGFPSGPGGGANSPATFPELADRIATEMGWWAMAPLLRGMPGSDGSFSLDGWRDDMVAAVDDLLARDDVTGVWTAGFGTGGALAICAAARNPRVRGAAALAAPADFSDWAQNPRRLLLFARDSGLVEDSPQIADFDRWREALRLVSAEQAVPDLAPRPLLLIHGTDDDHVPPLDARVVADAHGSADLRLIGGAGPHLRHAPRAVALLLGWLDRQRRLVEAG